MGKRIKLILTAVVIVLILAGGGTFFYLSGRVTMNPSGTVGNTAGNINNGGLFCEYDGRVYFAVPQTGGGLFSMNPDESDIQRLNGQRVANILAGGKYLYYFQMGNAAPSESGLWQLKGTHSFDRCKLNGKDSTALTTDVIVTAQLVDNYLYLLSSTASGPSFYKMKIDRSDRVDLIQEAINPACAENGVIYYNGTDSNHYLYALNTANDSADEYWRGNLWYPVKQGDYVYFMDVENNYRLCRYSSSQGIVEVLTQDRVDCFNVGSGYVYYQKNSATDPQLICMMADGSSPFTLAYGNYTKINMTSRYVYFSDFEDEDTVYHAPLGSSSYSVFSPDME